MRQQPTLDYWAGKSGATGLVIAGFLAGADSQSEKGKPMRQCNPLLGTGMCPVSAQKSTLCAPQIARLRPTIARVPA